MIDDYYTDPAHAEDRPVRAQLARQLWDPNPKDLRSIRHPARYEGLEQRWHDWSSVVDQCRRLAVHVSG